LNLRLLRPERTVPVSRGDVFCTLLMADSAQGL